MSSSGKLITTSDILNGTILTADIAADQITSALLAPLTIASGDIADGAVTDPKLASGLFGRFYKVEISGTNTTSASLVQMTGSTLSGVITSTGNLLFGITMIGYGPSGAVSGSQVHVYESAASVTMLFNEYMGSGLYTSKTAIYPKVVTAVTPHTYSLYWNVPGGMTISHNACLFWALELK